MNRLLTAVSGLRRRPAAHTPPLPYLGETLVGIETDAGLVWIPKSDGVIRPYLELNGAWEVEEAALLRQMFKPGLRFLDIGANVGYFSLLVAKECRGAQVHAFEPHPLTSQILALNAWNSAADITVHPLALSDSIGLLGVATSENNLGDSRTRTVSEADMLCPAAPLDEVLPDAVFDLVKIDVQGYESPVITGMMGMLRRSPGVVVVAEFWPSVLREQSLDPVAVLENYRSIGFKVRVQVDNDLAEVPAPRIVRICDSAGPNGQVNLVLTL